MRAGVYLGLILLLIPLQATFLDSMSPFGIRPDLCLVAACLIGFWTGHVRGFVMGFFLGFAQDLFSAGEFWLNTLTKSGVGFLSGLIAKNLANTSSHSVFFPMVVFSIFSGVVFLVSSRVGMGIGEVLHGFPSILLPQALFDGLVAVGVNWLIAQWIPSGSEA